MHEPCHRHRCTTRRASSPRWREGRSEGTCEARHCTAPQVMKAEHLALLVFAFACIASLHCSQWQRFREHPPLNPPSLPRGRPSGRPEGRRRSEVPRQTTSKTSAYEVRACTLPGSLRGGEGWTIRPPQAGGDRNVPAFSSGQDALSKSPASPQRTRSSAGCGGRRAGGPLFLVTSSLGKQRRSHSLSGRRAKPLALRARLGCDHATTEP
jgi:hypothetical protein